MRLFLDEDRLVPALQQMADLSMMEVEPLGVPPVDSLHPAGKIAQGRLQKKVKVIPHQAVSMQNPSAARDDLPENREEFLSVAIVPEDRRPVVSAARHVIDRAFEFEPQRASHTPRLYFIL